MLEFFKQIEKEPDSVNIDRLRQLHGLSSREELLSAIGNGTITLSASDRNVLQTRRNWRRYIPFMHKEGTQPSEPKTVVDRKKTLLLNEESIRHYLICEHCHPIPGDDVLGYINDKNSIVIHKRQCPIADKLKASDGNHILAAKWDTHKQLFFPATIHMEGIDHLGVMHQITEVLSRQLNVNMKRLNIEAQDGIFQGEILLEVHDVSDLQTICRDLKKIDEIKDVKRL